MCSWNKRINIVKRSILSNALEKLNTIPIKFTISYFTEIEKRIKETSHCDFKIYYKAIVIQSG